MIGCPEQNVDTIYKENNFRIRGTEFNNCDTIIQVLLLS